MFLGHFGLAFAAKRAAPRTSLGMLLLGAQFADLLWPLLLLAGANDPRCPKSEAQQVVDAIKKRNGVVDYKVYENEGHGFSRVDNQIDAFKRVSDFLKAHVPPADCSCEIKPI